MGRGAIVGFEIKAIMINVRAFILDGETCARLERRGLGREINAEQSVVFIIFFHRSQELAAK